MKKSGKLIKKSLSMLIAVVMIISMMPSTVFVQAEDVLAAPENLRVEIIDGVANVLVDVPTSVQTQAATAEVYAMLEYDGGDIASIAKVSSGDTTLVLSDTVVNPNNHSNMTAVFFIDENNDKIWESPEVISASVSTTHSITISKTSQTEVINVVVYGMYREDLQEIIHLGSEHANKTFVFTGTGTSLDEAQHMTNEDGYKQISDSGDFKNLENNSEGQLVNFYNATSAGDVYTQTITSNAIKFQFGATQTLTWSDGTADGEVKNIFKDDVFTAPTAENVQTGNITYATDNRYVAQVDETTGAVTIESTGTATITATAAPVGDYGYTSISYTLKIEEDMSTPSVEEFSQINGRMVISANGHEIKIVAGTAENSTNILYDINGDGTIADTEYMKIGANEPSAVGYDLTDVVVIGGNYYNRVDSTKITMTGGNIDSLFASWGEVTNDAVVKMSGGKVDWVLGSGAVDGDVHYTITGNAEISVILPKTVYNGIDVLVKGDAYLTIGGSVKIGSAEYHGNSGVQINGINEWDWNVLYGVESFSISDDLTDDAKVFLVVPAKKTAGTVIVTNAVAGDVDKLVFENGFVGEFDAQNNTIVLAKAPVAGTETPVIEDAVTEGGTTKVEATGGTYTNGETAELVDVQFIDEATYLAVMGASDNNTAPSVVINIETAPQVKFTTVPLPAYYFEAMADKGGDFSVNSGVAEVSFDSAALKGIVDSDVVEDILALEVNNLTNKPDALTDDQKAKVGDNIVVDLTLYTSDGTTISDFGTGKVTVRVPADYGDQDIEDVKVFFVKDDGTLEEMSATYFADEKVVEFTTSHFSVFMLEPVFAQTEPTQPTETPQTGDDSMMYVFIAVAVVSLLSILSVYKVLKKRKAN